jgi:hypothetical protein
MDKQQYLIVWYDGKDYRFDLVTFTNSDGPYEDKRRVKAFAETRGIVEDDVIGVVEIDKKSVNVYDQRKEVLKLLIVVEMIDG